MNAKTPLQLKLQKDTGLTIDKISSSQELEGFLDRGLADLYRSVFAEPPYLESFSQDEAKECFRDYLAKKGNIFIATDPARKDKIVAFLVSIPLRTRFDLAAQAKDYVDADKAAYFADTGVDPAYRRLGLSVSLKGLLFEANRNAGFKEELSRTSQDSYKQISAFNKVGGRVIAGLFQDVASKRLDGTTTTDRRIFYAYDVMNQEKDAAAATSVGRVIIARDAGKDTAYVMSKVEQKDQASLEKRIKTSYAGVTRVAFTSRPQEIKGNVVFDGRLYLSKEPSAPRKGNSGPKIAL